MAEMMRLLSSDKLNPTGLLSILCGFLPHYMVEGTDAEQRVKSGQRTRRRWMDEDCFICSYLHMCLILSIGPR